MKAVICPIVSRPSLTRAVPMAKMAAMAPKTKIFVKNWKKAYQRVFNFP